MDEHPAPESSLTPARPVRRVVRRRPAAPEPAPSWLYALLGLLAVVLVADLVITTSVWTQFRSADAKAGEAAKPAKISLALLQDPGCPRCVNLSAAIDSLKRGQVDVTKEETLALASPEAKALIAKYNLTKLPALIVTGETDKVTLPGGRTLEKAKVLEAAGAPYTDAATGAPRGLVQITYLTDAECLDCADLPAALGALASAGVAVTGERNVSWDSEEGGRLVEEYRIEKAPAALLSAEFSAYPALTETWDALGTVEADGTYIYRNAPAPYRNTTTKTVQGRVIATIISAPGCPNCTDLARVVEDFQFSGVTVVNTTALEADDPEAEDLIEAYGLERLPALFFNAELSAYPTITTEWAAYGTVEDGTYVYRTAAPPYINLTTGKPVGLVTLTYLNNSQCAACYDVRLHYPVLVARFQVGLKEIRVVDADSEEGEALRTQYGIDATPTIILSPEAKSYELLNRIWPQVGSVEEDGTYIFRAMKALVGQNWYNHTTQNISSSTR